MDSSVQSCNGLLRTIDSVVFGYLQRQKYTETVRCLMQESPHLYPSNQIGSDKVVISVNDAIFDKNLEDIIENFVSHGRFDLPKEFIDVASRLRQLSADFSTLTSINLNYSDAQKRIYGRKIPIMDRHFREVVRSRDTSEVGRNFDSAYSSVTNQHHNTPVFTGNTSTLSGQDDMRESSLHPTDFVQQQSTTSSESMPQLLEENQMDFYGDHQSSEQSLSHGVQDNQRICFVKRTNMDRDNMEENSKSTSTSMPSDSLLNVSMSSETASGSRRKPAHPVPLSERAKTNLVVPVIAAANRLISRGMEDCTKEKNGIEHESASNVSLISNIDEHALLSCYQQLEVDNIHDIFTGPGIGIDFGCDHLLDEHMDEGTPLEMEEDSLSHSLSMSVPIFDQPHSLVHQSSNFLKNDQIQELSVPSPDCGSVVNEIDERGTNHQSYDKNLQGVSSSVNSESFTRCESKSFGSKKSLADHSQFISIPAVQVFSSNCSKPTTNTEQNESHFIEDNIGRIEREHSPNVTLNNSNLEFVNGKCSETDSHDAQINLVSHPSIVVPRSFAPFKPCVINRESFPSSIPILRDSPLTHDVDDSSDSTSSKTNRRPFMNEEQGGIMGGTDNSNSREKESSNFKRISNDNDRLLSDLFNDDSGARPSSRESVSSRVSTRTKEEERRRREMERERTRDREKLQRRKEKDKGSEKIDRRRDRSEERKRRGRDRDGTTKHSDRDGYERDRGIRTKTRDNEEEREKERTEKERQRRNKRHEEEARVQRMIAEEKANEQRREEERRKKAEETEKKKSEERQRREEDAKRRAEAMTKKKEEEKKRNEEVKQRQEEKKLREEKEKEVEKEKGLKSGDEEKPRRNSDISRAMLQDYRKTISEKSKKRKENDDPLEKISQEMDELNREEEGVLSNDEDAVTNKDVEGVTMLSSPLLTKGVSPSSKNLRKNDISEAPLFSNPHHVPGGTPPQPFAVRNLPRVSNGIETGRPNFLHGISVEKVYKFGMVLAKLSQERKKIIEQQKSQSKDLDSVGDSCLSPQSFDNCESSPKQPPTSSTMRFAPSKRPPSVQETNKRSTLFDSSDEEEEKEIATLQHSSSSSPRGKKMKLDPREIQKVLGGLHGSTE